MMSVNESVPANAAQEHSYGLIPYTLLAYVHLVLIVLSAIGAWQDLAAAGGELPKSFEMQLYALFVVCVFPWAWMVSRRARLRAFFEGRSYVLFLAALLPLTAVMEAIPALSYRWVVTLIVLTVPAIVLAMSGRLHAKKADHSARKLLFAGIAVTIGLAAFFSRTLTAPYMLTMTLVWTGLLAFCLKFEAGEARWDLPLLVALLTFIFALLFDSRGDVHHYSFYLGPVVEMLYGSKHSLVEINSQYGPGVVWFLTQYFALLGHVSNEGLNLLLKILTLIMYVSIYVTLRSLYRSTIVALLTLGGVLVYTCFSQEFDYFSFPSIGVLRFGFIYFVLLLQTIHPLREREKLRTTLCALVAVVATIWSFESLVYTVPAWLFGELLNGTLKRSAFSYAGWMVLLGTLFCLPAVLAGKQIDFLRYSEYAAVYGGGFGQLPLSRVTDLWFAFPVLYCFVVLAVLRDRSLDVRAATLAVHGLAIFTYFVGRAHPNNLHHIALPFIVLGVYAIQRSSVRLRRLAIAGFLSIFLYPKFALFFLRGYPEFRVIRENASGSAMSALLNKSGNCSSDADVFRGVVRSGSLLLLTPSDSSYLVLDCLRASNGFNVSPWAEMWVSSRARDRFRKTASSRAGDSIFVAAGFENDSLVRQAVKLAGVKQVGSLSANTLVYANDKQ